MKTELLPITSITPYARNPRKNEGLPVAKVKASLKEYGWQQPIVVDRDMTIVVGHTRYAAALELGMAEVPVHIADNLTPTQIKAYRIADNKTATFSEWDMELLGLEFDDLKAEGFDLELTGFDDAELMDMEMDGEPETEGDTEERQTMAERFGIPPFSVLNAREGWWQARKQAWIAMGIQSELGRGVENTNMSHPETTSTIDFYAQKRKLEAELGHELTKDEAAKIIDERGGLRNARQLNKNRQAGG